MSDSDVSKMEEAIDQPSDYNRLDILKKLRSPERSRHTPAYLHNEAADEIERLRAQIVERGVLIAAHELQAKDMGEKLTEMERSFDLQWGFAQKPKSAQKVGGLHKKSPSQSFFCSNILDSLGWISLDSRTCLPLFDCHSAQQRGSAYASGSGRREQGFIKNDGLFFASRHKAFGGRFTRSLSDCIEESRPFGFHRENRKGLQQALGLSSDGLFWPLLLASVLRWPGGSQA